MKTGIPNPAGDAAELLVSPADASILRMELRRARVRLVHLVETLDAASVAGAPRVPDPQRVVRVVLTVEEVEVTRKVLTDQIDRIDAMLTQLDAMFPRPAVAELADDGTRERFADLPTDALWWSGAPMPCTHCGASVDEKCAPDCMRRLPTTPPPGIEPDDDGPEAA